ncbi:hypothetical protein VTO73DRAFT_3056 [Trametes versicolor]
MTAIEQGHRPVFLRLIVVIIVYASTSRRTKRGLGAPSIQRPTFMTDHRHLQGRVSKRQGRWRRFRHTSQNVLSEVEAERYPRNPAGVLAESRKWTPRFLRVAAANAF